MWAWSYIRSAAAACRYIFGEKRGTFSLKLWLWHICNALRLSNSKENEKQLLCLIQLEWLTVMLFVLLMQMAVMIIFFHPKHINTGGCFNHQPQHWDTCYLVATGASNAWNISNFLLHIKLYRQVISYIHVYRMNPLPRTHSDSCQ